MGSGAEEEGGGERGERESGRGSEEGGGGSEEEGDGDEEEVIHVRSKKVNGGESRCGFAGWATWSA